MSDLTYTPPTGLPASIAVGDAVEVLDLQGAVIGTKTVNATAPRSVTTSDGREWDRRLVDGAALAEWFRRGFSPHSSPALCSTRHHGAPALPAADHLPFGR